MILYYHPESRFYIGCTKNIKQLDSEDIFDLFKLVHIYFADNLKIPDYKTSEIFD